MAVTFNCMAVLGWTISRRFTGLKEVYLVNLRTFSMRVPPQIKEIQPEDLNQTLALYSQILEEERDRFISGVAPHLKVAVFVS